MRKQDLYDLAVRLGKDSHSAVTSGQLRAAASDITPLSLLVRDGTATLIVRGMYVFGDLTEEGLAWAAVKHARQRLSKAKEQPEPIITGFAGARALGLRWVPPGQRVQVLVGPEVKKASSSFVLVRRTKGMEELETTEWAGLRVAMVPQVLLDAERECRSLQDIRGLVLGAVGDDRVSVAELQSMGGPSRFRRAVLDAYRGCVSPPEAEVVDLLVGKGRPFYVNCELWIDGVLIAVVDVYLVGTATGGEVDGVEYHSDEERLSATVSRTLRVRDHQIVLRHRTPKRFRDNPNGFIREHFSYADQGRLDPPGLVLKPRGPLLS